MLTLTTGQVSTYFYFATKVARVASKNPVFMLESRFDFAGESGLFARIAERAKETLRHRRTAAFAF